MKNNLKVDWTGSPRKDVYASIESAVKMVLCRRKLKDEQFRFLQNQLVKQAEARYADWPLAAGSVMCSHSDLLDNVKLKVLASSVTLLI